MHIAYPNILLFSHPVQKVATNLILIYVWWSDTIVCNIHLHRNTTHIITSDIFEICKENYTLETSWPRASFNREYYEVNSVSFPVSNFSILHKHILKYLMKYAQDKNITKHILKQKPLSFIPISHEMTIEIIKASCCELGKLHFYLNFSLRWTKTYWIVIGSTHASTISFVLLRGNSTAITIVTSELMACRYTTPPTSHNCSINCVYT